MNVIPRRESAEVMKRCMVCGVQAKFETADGGYCLEHLPPAVPQKGGCLIEVSPRTFARFNEFMSEKVDADMALGMLMDRYWGPIDGRSMP